MYIELEGNGINEDRLSIVEVIHEWYHLSYLIIKYDIFYECSVIKRDIGYIYILWHRNAFLDW